MCYDAPSHSGGQNANPWNETARVHRGTRRRGCVAAGGAGAAGGETADHRVSGRDHAFGAQWTAAFVQRLRELGWIEGRTVAIEYRWAEGRSERAAEIAAEFVRFKVDVIVTSGTSPVLAAKQAAAAIPIVFAAAGDPVGTGLVASLARPGGNVTACHSRRSTTLVRSLNFCARLSPVSAGWRSWSMSAVLGVLELGEVQAMARTLGLEVITSEFRRAEDIAPAFEALKDRAEALYVVPTRS